MTTHAHKNLCFPLQKVAHREKIETECPYRDDFHAKCAKERRLQKFKVNYELIRKKALTKVHAQLTGTN